MKIISWNVGNFTWAKFLPKRENNSFYLPDLDHIADLIKKEHADIICLLEIHTRKDAEVIFQKFPEFKYTKIVILQNRISQPIIMSKHEIIHLSKNGEDYYKINNINFYPIHFNAYSPAKRSMQIDDMLPKIINEKTIILGDTNFWIINNFIFSKKDKNSYHKIINNFTDTCYGLGSTLRSSLATDKIFISKDISLEKSKIVKHKIGHIDHYMLVTEML